MNPDIVVSLTSFPARINKVWLVVETILRQSLKPKSVILWLSKEQFDGVECLPKKLVALEKRGLRIEFVDEDIKSHKKYYYSFIEYPEDCIVTVDDDVFYNTHILEYLWRSHLRYPDCVCCNQSHVMTFDKDGKLLPYSQWRHNKNELILTPSSSLCPIGIGGILYPPHSLHDMVSSKAVFMECCPRADDIWLKAMSLLNGTSVVQTEYHSMYLPVINKNDVHLSSDNIKHGNDIQINSLREFFYTQYGYDPFSYEYMQKKEFFL